MLGRDEDVGRVVNADGIVGRRMHDEQRLMQVGDMRHQAVLGDVVEELALDAEWAAGERNLDFAGLSDVLDPFLEQARDMGRIGRGGDGDDRLGVRDLRGRGQDRRAAEAVADQDGGGFTGFAEVTGRTNEVGNVGREGRVGEIALAGAKAREIEPQHRDAACCQCCRNSFRRQHILAAGEAMREQRVGSWFAFR